MPKKTLIIEVRTDPPTSGVARQGWEFEIPDRTIDDIDAFLEAIEKFIEDRGGYFTE